ncbi:TniQ family protein [Variovorax flavidus]|uniref:TniQ family protein n=1 Tax=Variovorax flavidus TaxID=3053501 RepID=UPI0033656B55
MLTEPKLTYLPDETVFSLVGRQHRLWGFSSTRSTAHVLFGNARCRLRHDFPRALENLARQMDGAAGSALDAALEHTVLRYYFPFQTDEGARCALQSMCRSGGTSTKNCLGLQYSRVGAQHPLKACPTCMRSDLASYGWTYWKLRHQFPGVWVCPFHGEPLMVCSDHECIREGGPWRLPQFERLNRNWAAKLKDQDVNRLARFSSMTIRAVEIYQTIYHFDIRAVVQMLKIKMEKYGWINAKSGHIKARDAAWSWSRYSSPLRFVPGFRWDEVTLGKYFPALLIHSTRARAHPLEVLMAIDWLVGDLEAFVSACSSGDCRKMGTREAEPAQGCPVERSIVWRPTRSDRPLYARRPGAPFALKPTPSARRRIKKSQATWGRGKKRIAVTSIAKYQGTPSRRSGRSGAKFHVN